jgi:hypothetical protein
MNVDLMAETRGCGTEGCRSVMSVPSPSELLEGEQSCPGCGEVYDIDEKDLGRWIVHLLHRIEWLEQCNTVEYVVLGDNPLSDCPIL